MARGDGSGSPEPLRGRVAYPFRVVTRRNASLKPQLNQIRTWVQEGATDIWIAHKLGSTPASISRFRRQHDLRLSDEAPGPAAATVTEAEVAESAAETPAKPRTRQRKTTPKAEPKSKPAAKAPSRSRSKQVAPELEAAPEAEFTAPPEVIATGEAEAAAEGEPAKRRRGRRGGRGRSRGGDAPLELEAVFDHGEEGYGLWLDGAIRDAGIYRKHWQGHADVFVKITADEIVIRRAGGSGDDA